MSSTDLVLRLIGLLDQLGVPYMLVGSYSSSYFGRPRSTKDADFVVQIGNDKLSALAQLLGSEFVVDRQMSFETVTMTSRYVIRHPKTAFKIELFLLSDDLHDRERFSRRQQVDFEGVPTWMPRAEDVVITKLRWSKGGKRSKDIADVAQVLAVQLGRLDLDYIRHWCDQHGTRSLFDQLLTEAQRFDEEHP